MIGDDSDGDVERVNGARFGSGVYCTPRVEEAELYAEPIEVSADVDGVATTKYYHVIFQCRVRGPACASHAEAVSKRGYYNVGLGEDVMGGASGGFSATCWYGASILLHHRFYCSILRAIADR